MGQSQTLRVEKGACLQLESSAHSGGATVIKISRDARSQEGDGKER